MPAPPSGRSDRCSSTARTRSSCGRRGSSAWWRRAVAEIASVAVALGRALGAGPERSLRFARAAQLVSRPEELYWVARAVFCSSREEVEAFERLFGVRRKKAEGRMQEVEGP